MPAGIPPPIAATLESVIKPWWRSKTLWFNAVVIALATAEASFGVLQPLLPANAYACLTFGLAVGNAVLRFISNTQLALRGVQPPASAGPQEGPAA